MRPQSGKDWNRPLKPYFTERRHNVFYHEAGGDMAYLEDTGNHDVRTEGMSYGMMVCVQMDKKAEFDRLWKWVRTYMYIPAGPAATILPGPAARMERTMQRDRHRTEKSILPWHCFLHLPAGGDGEGIFAYSKEAKAILRECIHKGEPGHPGEPMWEPSNHLIKFVTNMDFSDPSYHLPHFYELFAEKVEEEDREFWRQAAAASREYLHKACHPQTGLSAEYADYDGTPHAGHQEIFGKHDWYYSDAYRTIANIAMDHLWYDKDPWQTEIANRLQRFYCEEQREHWTVCS